MSFIYAAELWNSLGFFDKYLAPFILVAMIVGVLIGVYAVSLSIGIIVQRDN